MGGAQAAGLKGALVKTGKFRPADLEGDVRPHVVLRFRRRFAALVETRYYPLTTGGGPTNTAPYGRGSVSGATVTESSGGLAEP